MKRKILTSIFCLIFLFSMTAMAFATPQDGYYINGHRYDLTLTKTDAAYQTYLSDMEAIDWDFSKVIIVTNNSFTNVQAAVNEDSIPGTLQPDAHLQVGTAIPNSVNPIASDGTVGPSEPVSNSPVTGAVAGVTLDQDTLNLTVGGASATLIASVSPADATNKNVTWSSSNNSVATVAGGVVTPVAAGSATITVTTVDGGFTDTCAVTVEAASIAVTGVTLGQDTLSLSAGGDTAALVATVAPADATNQNVTWSSSNNSVATVAGGVVTPVADGNATITVTTVDGGFTDTCAVTVATAGPTTAAEAIEMAIANFAPAKGNGTFTGSIPGVKVAGDVTVEKVAMVPATTTLTSSSVKSSFLDVNIQSAKIANLIVGTVTANNFPFAEIIAGPTASGTSLVTSGTLTSDADNYYIQLTNADCPQSVLDIITAAANLNDKYQMTFKSQKLSCKIKISKSTKRVVSVDNTVITGTTTITKSSLSMANGDYSNTFNCNSFTVTY